MHDALISIAGILSLTSGLPYAIDIAKNKTHPNLITWITWTAVATINTLAAISDGAIHTAILSGTIVLTNLVIVVMGFKKGVKKYTPFDIICQVIAIIGVVLWLMTGDASLAVLLSVTVILIGALPTWRHAWLAPFEETWQGFVMGATAAALTLLSISSFTFVSVAFPLIALINCSVVVGIILSRRQLIRRLV